MLFKNFKYFALAALLLGLASTVYATGAGFYFGAQAGQSNLHNDTKRVETGGTPAYVNVSPSNTGFGGRLFLGYAANPYLAVESGLTYYTPSKYDTGVSPACGNPSIRETAFDVVAKGTYPFSTTGFGIYGKAGAAVARINASGRLSQQTLNSCSGDDADTSIRPTAGVGISYDATQNWVVDLSWTRVFAGGDFPNADLIAFGVSYHFVDKMCGQFLC